ncbi:hypothetical protein NN561_010566 [Cricetulus griseus]
MPGPLVAATLRRTAEGPGSRRTRSHTSRGGRRRKRPTKPKGLWPRTEPSMEVAMTPATHVPFDPEATPPASGHAPSRSRHPYREGMPLGPEPGVAVVPHVGCWLLGCPPQGPSSHRRNG